MAHYKEVNAALNEFFAAIPRGEYAHDNPIKLGFDMYVTNGIDPGALGAAVFQLVQEWQRKYPNVPFVTCLSHTGDKLVVDLRPADA